MAAGLAAAIVLAILATAAAASTRHTAATPAPPALTRVAAPNPMPEGVATPVTEPKPPPPKPKVKQVAAPPTSTTTTTTLPPPPVVAPGPEIPTGKGMWVWKPELAEGGNVAALVSRAQAVGLTHVYVRTGSTWDGIQNLQYLDQLLPAAHAVGLKIYGWDFPKLASPDDDVFRAKMALDHLAPGGDHLDGFASDIETSSEGTEFTSAGVAAYGAALRKAAGPSTLLVAVVPNPTPQMRLKYNYVAVLPEFDAVAPMVYWLNRDAALDTANALHFLAQYGKPLMPIGQAYDGGPEGGPPGVPPPAELRRFIEVSKQYGAVAVSFWSWQHANPPAWDAIKNAPQFLVPLKPSATKKKQK
jgi:hypothetical protein